MIEKLSVCRPCPYSKLGVCCLWCVLRCLLCFLAVLLVWECGGGFSRTKTRHFRSRVCTACQQKAAVGVSDLGDVGRLGIERRCLFQNWAVLSVSGLMARPGLRIGRRDLFWNLAAFPVVELSGVVCVGIWRRHAFLALGGVACLRVRGTLSSFMNHPVFLSNSTRASEILCNHWIIEDILFRRRV